MHHHNQSSTHPLGSRQPRGFGRRQRLGMLLLAILLWLGSWGGWSPAWAGLTDDHYDGNIFALYGSNGGMLPPRMTLEQAQAKGIPSLLVYYIDDSRDCKRYAAVVANLQVRYGLGVNFVAYAVDSLDLEDPTGLARYFTGRVPQTLLFDASGQVVYQSTGSRSLTEVENAIRGLFGLAPVEAANKQAQSFNEVQTGFGSQPAPSKPKHPAIQANGSPG
ncbi:MAG: thylakoid membrane photosystem I accumulation factor [Cyanobacteriota bacterium]|nr:thylakoid membrane photosystem I accumulation factor [Cyanobacteriota bacterium]